MYYISLLEVCWYVGDLSPGRFHHYTTPKKRGWQCQGIEEKNASDTIHVEVRIGLIISIHRFFDILILEFIGAVILRVGIPVCNKQNP